MNAIPPERRKVGNLERHIQTAIQIILVALIMWVGNTSLETRDSITELKTQMTEARQQIGEMNQRFDRYLLRTEADARFDSLKAQNTEIAARLDRIDRGIPR